MDETRTMRTQCAADLVAEWRLEADRMERRGLGEPVCFIRSLADQLEAVLRQQTSEVLTLKDASAASGYSTDHLGRMVREGAIPNAGRPGAPRIRLGDLPRKAGALTVSGRASTLRSSKAAIVRSIANQRN